MKKVLSIVLLAMFATEPDICRHTPKCENVKAHIKKVLKAPPPSGVVINEIY